MRDNWTIGYTQDYVVATWWEIMTIQEWETWYQEQRGRHQFE